MSQIENSIESGGRRESEDRFRRFDGPLDLFLKWFAALGCFFFLLNISGVFAWLKIYFLPNQYNAMFLGVVLTLTFFLIPAGKKAPRDRLPWYDVVFIVFTLAGCLYIIINAYELAHWGKLRANTFEVVLASMIVITLLEAVRRSFGLPMIIVVVCFLLYAKFGYLAPKPFKIYYFGLTNLAADIYLSSGGIYGFLTRLSGTIILSFIAFGIFFVTTGGGKFIMNVTLALTGSMTGGPAKSAIVGSALFGTLSGSPTGNVAVTGSITIPLMKSMGYRPFYAAAVETIASTGGGIAPPVMANLAFIMAAMLAVPYTRIASAAIIPSFLFFLSIFAQVHLQAQKMGLKAVPRDQLPAIIRTLREGWEFIIPFVCLVYMLLVLRWPPEVSALYSIVIVVFATMFRKEHRVTFNRLIESLGKTIMTTVPIANVLALAGIIIAVLTITGVGPKLSAGLVDIAGGNTVVLILAAGVASYIMGMGISWTASYILVASLVAPALIQLGIPDIVAHFFIMYMVLSTGFTPPYCQTAFVAAAIAGAKPFKTGFQAMRLGIVCFLVPFVIVLNPALLWMGTSGEILTAALSATIGVIGLSIGIEGYFLFKTNLLQRILFILGGLLMTIPGISTDAVGVLLLAVAAVWQWLQRRGRKVEEVPVEAFG